MTIGERVKEARKSSGLTQADFGKRVKISGASVSMIEKGINNPSEQTITLICAEFGIREEWLRTGNGSMKEEKPRDVELAEGLDKLLTAGTDDFRKSLIAWLVRMPPEHWRVLETITLDLLKDVRNLTDAAKPAPAPEPRNVHDWTPDKLIEEATRQVRAEEADREKGTTAQSTGSPNVSGVDCA